MTRRVIHLNMPYLVSLTVLVLMALGTVSVFSAGVNLGSDITLSNFLTSVRFRNLIFFLVGMAVLYGSSAINYNVYDLTRPPFKNITYYLLAISFVLLVLVLIPGIGTEVNQARRWLRISIAGVAVNFQPSEMAKWVSLLFLAGFLARYSDRLKGFLKGFVPACAVVGVMVALIVTQDFGTAFFIAVMAFVMLLIGGAVWWHFLTPLPIIIPAFCFLIMTSATRMNRIKAFYNPQEFASTTGYQARQSLIAISTGGFAGKGLGMGTSNYGHLPEDTTDFIFAIIAHEMGFVGAVLVMLLYIAFVLLGVCVVVRCKDLFGRLLASGIVICVSLQAAINLGVVTVVLPTKGIPLPFVSAGGTSLLLSAFAVGILINIAKQTAVQDEIEHGELNVR